MRGLEGAGRSSGPAPPDTSSSPPAPCLETVISLQLVNPSGAFVLAPAVLLLAVIVIRFDRQAQRDLGVCLRDKLAPIPFFIVVAPLYLLSTPFFIFVPSMLLAPFLSHMLQAFTGFFVSTFTIHMQLMHVFPAAFSPILLRARHWCGNREEQPDKNRQFRIHGMVFRCWEGAGANRSHFTNLIAANMNPVRAICATSTGLLHSDVRLRFLRASLRASRRAPKPWI